MAEQPVPWRWWIAPVAVVFGLVMGVLFDVVVQAIGAGHGGSFSHPGAVTLIVADIVFDLCFVAAALLLLRSWHTRARDFGFRRVPFGTAVLWIVAGAIVYYVITAIYAVVFSLHGHDQLPKELSNPGSPAAIAITCAFVCVVAPICEEFFFRGFIFGTLRQMRVRVGRIDLSVWVAAAITGLLFGLVHFSSASPQFLIPLGFLGFVLCILRWRTGSLYPGMALHAGNNALAYGGGQLHWSAGAVVALVVGSWLVVAVIAGPIGARNPSIARPLSPPPANGAAHDG